MAGKNDAAEQLRQLGWRQGSVLGPSLVAGLSDRLPADAEVAVAVSQDCDAVAETTIEESVEIIPGTETETPDAGLLHGRHPRRIALPFEGSDFHLVLDIRRRVCISKSALAEVAPDGSRILSPRNVRQLARWLAKRYLRDAFPDAFNSRLHVARGRFDKLSKAEHGKRVSAIFVSMEEPNAELPSDRPYRVALYFACRPVALDDPKVAAAIERFATEFVDAMKSCKGIVVDEYEVVGHDRITLENLEDFKRFDFDYRSAAAKPGGEGPATSEV